MKEYEGPAYGKGINRPNIPKMRFNRGPRQPVGKYRFEPAFQSEQGKKDKQTEEKIKAHTETDLNKEKQQANQASEPILSLEHYDVPFLRHKKPDKQANLEAKPDNKATEEENNETNMKSERATYSPSYVDKEKQTTEKEFKSTELPKPYKEMPKMSEIDRNSRMLAQRLVKTRDSFILFEQ